MAPNRIMRRGASLRAPWILIACLGLSLALAACGSSGGSTTVTVTQGGGSAPSSGGEVDQEADAEALDGVLSRQTAAVAAYERTLPHLHGKAREAAQLFEAQEQEHVDGLLKAFRALGEKAEPTEEAIEAEGLKTEPDHLLFLYEMESATVRDELDAIARITSPTARSTLSSTVANQAQHLTVLRTLLGADLENSMPSAFENGTAGAP